MTLYLPRPEDIYDKKLQDRANRALELADEQNIKRGEDAQQITWAAPDGTGYYMTVEADGRICIENITTGVKQCFIYGNLWDHQYRVNITGVLPLGDEDVTIRFLASSITDSVRVHIQNTTSGGEVYSTLSFVSDVRVDTSVNRQQDYTVSRGTRNDYYLWLVPESFSSGVYTKYDGSDGEGADQMAFVTVGANSGTVREIAEALEDIRRLIAQQFEMFADSINEETPEDVEEIAEP